MYYDERIRLFNLNLRVWYYVYLNVEVSINKEETLNVALGPFQFMGNYGHTVFIHIVYFI